MQLCVLDCSDKMAEAIPAGTKESDPAMQRGSLQVSDTCSDRTGSVLSYCHKTDKPRNVHMCFEVGRFCRKTWCACAPLKLVFWTLYRIVFPRTPFDCRNTKDISSTVYCSACTSSPIRLICTHQVTCRTQSARGSVSLMSFPPLKTVNFKAPFLNSVAGRPFASHPCQNMECTAACATRAVSLVSGTLAKITAAADLAARRK